MEQIDPRLTLTALRDCARADINAHLKGAGRLLRRSNLDVIATTLSGAVHGFYGFIDFVARQVIIDSAEPALADVLRRDAVPGGTILINHIRVAISIAAGENDYTMPTAAADVTDATGEIAVMGTVTWPS